MFAVTADARLDCWVAMPTLVAAEFGDDVKQADKQWYSGTGAIRDAWPAFANKTQRLPSAKHWILAQLVADNLNLASGSEAKLLSPPPQ